MIRGLHFKNFSIFKDFRLGLQVEDLPALLASASPEGETVSEPAYLSSLVGLIGENSSGKSSIFEALAYLRDIVRHNLASASTMGQRRGYARIISSSAVPGDSMELSLILQAAAWSFYSYSLKLSADKHERPFILEERLDSFNLERGFTAENLLLQKDQRLSFRRSGGEGVELKLSDRKETALNFLGRVVNYPELCWVYEQIKGIFVYRIKGNLRLESMEKGGHKHLKETRNNLANVLAYWQSEDAPSYHKWLQESLQKFPDWSRRRGQFNLEELSDGELRLFRILVLLRGNYSLICLDEPGVNLYYKLVDVLMKEMRDYTLAHPQAQIFYTTHNYNLLQGLKPQELWLLKRHGEAITARSAASDPIVEAMYEQGLDMGMLLYGGYLEEY